MGGQAVRQACSVCEMDVNMQHGVLECAQNGDFVRLRRLLDAGAKVDVRNQDGESAICIAAANGHMEVCKALIGSGCDINATTDDYSTPLMLAAEEGHLAICRLLLESGAMEAQKDENGFTAADRCDQTMKADFQLLVREVSAGYCSGAAQQQKDGPG
mmetsp:Transcript_12779/g.30588  ORF Transcript_12779/g.30588 Transcript_12779/m.30588 type:complete len:158 (+) Transcript_12779:105-578(+)